SWMAPTPFTVLASGALYSWWSLRAAPAVASGGQSGRVTIWGAASGPSPLTCRHVVMVAGAARVNLEPCRAGARRRSACSGRGYDGWLRPLPWFAHCDRREFLSAHERGDSATPS